MAPRSPFGAHRRAAIALVLLEQEEGLEVLLIERAHREGDPWSGHIALPGGHVEPSDADLAATAERETIEEVGLDLRRAGERLGQLSECSPVRGVPLTVRPYVYLLAERPELTLGDEVQRALWVPIAPLQRGERRATHLHVGAGQQVEFPAWDVGGHLVWGLTYRVLSELFSRFRGLSAAESAELDNSHQPR